jgi:hypothetical protein
MKRLQKIQSMLDSMQCHLHNSPCVTHAINVVNVVELDIFKINFSLVFSFFTVKMKAIFCVQCEIFFFLYKYLKKKNKYFMLIISERSVQKVVDYSHAKMQNLWFNK